MAASFAEISAATRQIMKRSPVLLGTKIADEGESSKKGERRGSVGADAEDDTITVSYELLRPDQVCVSLIRTLFVSHTYYNDTRSSSLMMSTPTPNSKKYCLEHHKRIFWSSEYS